MASPSSPSNLGQMASARRIDLSTAVRIARRISNHCHGDLSTAVQQRRGIGIPQCWFGSSHRDLSTVTQWRGIAQWPKCPFTPNTRHCRTKIGYTVDVADLLSSPERDFLVKNNAQKVKVDDLLGKTILLFIVPLDRLYKNVMSDTWDMIDAYYELLRVGTDVEFVFVPVQFGSDGPVYKGIMSPEALFHKLFSAMPFPAIPFSDVPGPEDPVVQTFSVDHLVDDYEEIDKLPYWVLVGPTSTVVATRFYYPTLFKSFGGGELHPLSGQRISNLVDRYDSESRVQRIKEWDQLLASDTRDFLLSTNGDKVPISSLKGKLVGLYFCENIPHPPRMQAIKKVYEEARLRGYDFEIVQITFHYHPFNAKHIGTDPTVQQCREDISWLTLPFKDPSCRKLQHILECVDDEDQPWVGDSLVLIHPRQAEAEAEADHDIGALFEFAGAEILERWGIEGYPFTRPSIHKVEYELQKRQITLQSLFPPGECLWRPRSAGDGFDLVHAFPQLSGKRVLILFVMDCWGIWEEDSSVVDHFGNFISIMKSKYGAQVEGNVAEESKFEVVYVSTESTDATDTEQAFDDFAKDMPWLLRHFSEGSSEDLMCKVFKQPYVREPAAAAFNEQGELIAKEDNLLEKMGGGMIEKMEGDKLQFPFIDQDLEKFIRWEVEELCVATDSEG